MELVYQVPREVGEKGWQDQKPTSSCQSWPRCKESIGGAPTVGSAETKPRTRFPFQQDPFSVMGTDGSGFRSSNFTKTMEDLPFSGNSIPPFYHSGTLYWQYCFPFWSPLITSDAEFTLGIVICKGYGEFLHNPGERRKTGKSQPSIKINIYVRL